MDESELSLLAYRVQNLEAVEAALRLEVHDLRTELRTLLRSDFMTRAEMRNVFITRKELASRGRERREWWPIVLAVVVGLPTIANLIISIAAGGH